MGNCQIRFELVQSDIFEYIEMFYNSKRRHGSNGQRSPLDYEKAHQKMIMCVQNFGGYSKRYGINHTTVAKWKKRTSVDDPTTGPKNPRSSVLSPEDEAAIVAFRKRTLLPLDDCLYALQPSIPYLTRSSLHCCLQRHGISRLPDLFDQNF